MIALSGIATGLPADNPFIGEDLINFIQQTVVHTNSRFNKYQHKNGAIQIHVNKSFLNYSSVVGSPQ